MNWSADSMEALRRWLGPETAYKWHPIDDAMFYLFIGHVWRDCQSLWDEAEARDIMKREAKSLHPDWSSEFIGDFVEKRQSEGTLILDFLCALRDENKWSLVAP